MDREGTIKIQVILYKEDYEKLRDRALGNRTSISHEAAVAISKALKPRKR